MPEQNYNSGVFSIHTGIPGRYVWKKNNKQEESDERRAVITVKCQVEGCKKRARPGSNLCGEHQVSNKLPDKNLNENTGLPKKGEAAAASDPDSFSEKAKAQLAGKGVYEQILTDEEIELFENAPDSEIFSLDQEIKMSMVLLAGLYRQGKFSDASAVAVRKARLLETRQKLMEAGEQDLARELENLLEEMDKAENPIGFHVTGGQTDG